VRVLPAIAATACAVLLAGCGGGSSSGSTAGSSSGGSTSASSGSASSGNGVASESAAQIVADAKKAAAGASSVHVSGTIAESGSQLKLDLTVSNAGKAKGTITTGGASFQLVRVGKTLYIKGTEAFYKKVGGSAAASLLAGKWLKVPTTSQQFSSVGSVTNMSQLIGGTLAAHGAISKAGTTTFQGQQVVGIKDKASGGILYVATTGKPYPVGIARTGSGGGQVVFDQWGKPVSVKAPSGALDISTLTP
jgi:hypothetical protein